MIRFAVQVLVFISLLLAGCYRTGGKDRYNVNETDNTLENSTLITDDSVIRTSDTNPIADTHSKTEPEAIDAHCIYICSAKDECLENGGTDIGMDCARPIGFVCCNYPDDDIGTDDTGPNNSQQNTALEYLCFAPFVNADINETYTSNTIIVTGLGEEGTKAELLETTITSNPARAHILQNDQEEGFFETQVFNGDRIEVQLYLDGSHDAALLAIGEAEGIFAVTTLPYEGEPVDQGTMEAPLQLSGLSKGHHLSVGKGASYYTLILNTEEGTGSMGIFGLTNLINVSIYDNPEFSGAPICTRYSPNASDYCDIVGYETIYVKIENANPCDGAFFTFQNVV